ncbi:MAG: hypothetical protein ACHQIH_03355 [Ignavibacteria bacterium]
MRSLLHFLFVLFIFSALTYLYSQDKNLSVKLSIEKDVYRIEELIVVRVQFTNFDTAQYRIEYNCSLEDDILWRLIFIDEEGTIIKFKSDLVYCCIGGHINVNPSGSYESYGAPAFRRASGRFGGNMVLPDGSYSLYYSSPLYGNSDTVKFRIIKDKRIDSYNSLLKLRLKTDIDERIDGWRKFLMDERNSDYANYAIDELRIIKNSEKENALKIEDLFWYFGINPDAWSTDVYLFDALHLVRSRYGEIKMYEFLNKLINKYPDTRVSVIAKKIVDDKEIPDSNY